MARGHIVECAVAILVRRIPVDAFPVFAQQRVKGISGRKGYANTESALGASGLRFNQVVLVIEIHMLSHS